MLLNTPLPPLWLQELHNFHLLPKQLKHSRNKWKNRPIYTKNQSIQQVIVHILKSGASIKVQWFYASYP